MSTNDTLLSPTRVGGLDLNNRVVMAPMTRNQSPENVPTDANVEYYRKRAAGGVGLIVTEGTCVDHIAASGYPGVPLHSRGRATGWLEARCRRGSC
jgi:2,4-dienoyl-CoA reductase-like NADH-dependent reductase (Old Yellow Enzyme family)